MTTSLPLRNLLAAAAPKGRILDAAVQLAGYDTDGLGYKRFRPDWVILPNDADELVEVVRVLRAARQPICMRGAGTSLAGGPVAAQGGAIVHTSRLRGIREIVTEGLWCEVECGVTLGQLETALKPTGLFYPPDPSSGSVCTIGGNVATNAGGAHCFRYGVTSNYVLGVEVLTLDGQLHRFGGPAGGRGSWREDWKRLMIGSEGTLGAFTRFWLRLMPRPESAFVFRAFYPDLTSTEQAIQALVRHPAYPVAIELMDPRAIAMVENSLQSMGLPGGHFMLLVEIDGPAALVNARAPAIEALLREAGGREVAGSSDPAEQARLYKARKTLGGLLGQLSPDFLVQDAVIPKRALAEVLRLIEAEADHAGLPVVTIMHAGDGNLHPNFLFDSQRPGDLEKVEAISHRLMEKVVALGGALSGEHGIGNDKTRYMDSVFSPEAMRFQVAVSRAFDPHFQLNPLKVFPARRFTA